jgi:DNA-binding transcriptional LysR family regulator
VAVTFAPAIGPTIGGYLTENYGWRTIFFVNTAPSAAMVIALAFTLEREPMKLSLLKEGDWAGISASGLSEAVRRLEAQLGIRLLNRTTRSVVLTEAGKRLLERLTPALSEVEAAVDVARSLGNRPAATLKLNVPVSAVRLVLPAIVPAFLRAYPDIRLEVVAEESFVDVLAAGCDACIRYGERLEQDMIAVPIGPRQQRFAVACENAPNRDPSYKVAKPISSLRKIIS